MRIDRIVKLVVDALEDIKGRDILVLNTRSQTALFDRIVIASGDSTRQTAAMAENVRERAKAAGLKVVGLEGERTGEWVLVDLGDVVVHIMQPAIRSYYNLEELWGASAKPVKPKPALARKAKAGA